MAVVSGRRDGVSEMIRTPAINSAADTGTAIAYLLEHAADSRLVQYLGQDALISECESISVVASLPCPREAKYGSPIGGKAEPGRLWLIQEAAAYLQETSNGVVLIEDLNSLPSDPYLTKRDHPPFWCYDDRIFWPILPPEATCHAIEQMMGWATAMREFVCFSRVPYKLNLASETRSLTQDEFIFIASSLKTIVTDVFDGEGYMKWYRR